jgi:hypothetical protein
MSYFWDPWLFLEQRRAGPHCASAVTLASEEIRSASAISWLEKVFSRKKYLRISRGKFAYFFW